jgi:hypothetical protein
LDLINLNSFPYGQEEEKTVASKGWFIYPTLSEEQPYLIAQWEKGFDQVIKEWT